MASVTSSAGDHTLFSTSDTSEDSEVSLETSSSDETDSDTSSSSDSDSDSDSEGIGDSDSLSDSDSAESTEVGDSNNEDEITTITIKPEPYIQRTAVDEVARNLKDRIETFLPKLGAANDQLEVERMEGRLSERQVDNVEESDGRYIEMVRRLLALTGVAQLRCS